MRGLLVVARGELLVLVGKPEVGPWDGKPRRVELVFEVFRDVESGRFWDFGWKFEVVACAEVGRIDYARNCGRSGQGWDAAVTDDVML